MLTTLAIAAPLVILGLLIYAAAFEEQRLVDGAEPPNVGDEVQAPESRRVGSDAARPRSRFRAGRHRARRHGKRQSRQSEADSDAASEVDAA